MPRNIRAPLLAAGTCLAAFGLLAYAAYSVGPIEHLDLRVFLHFQLADPSGRVLANLLVHLGDLGPLLAMMAAVVAVGLHFGRRREVVAAMGVVVAANLMTQVLKIALEHSRQGPAAGGGSPSYWADLLPTSNAFPSGHTTAAAAVAVALLLVVPARHALAAGAVGILLVASVGGSVVVSGWHYPSDALGAILIAATCGFLAVAALRAPARPRRASRRATIRA